MDFFSPHKVLTTAVSIQYFGLELSMTFLLGVILVSRKPRKIDQDIELLKLLRRGDDVGRDILLKETV